MKKSTFFHAGATFFHARITFFHAQTTFFHARITFFHAGRCSVKKSNFSVKKRLFFTLASMKKSRFGKEKLYLFWKVLFVLESRRGLTMQCKDPAKS
jgi:hypothetical protein